MMDAWLANGFVGEDLLVNRAGTANGSRSETWPRSARGKAARAEEPRRRSATPGAATERERRGPGDRRERRTKKRRRSVVARGGALADDGRDGDGSLPRKRTVAVSSRYTESVDARVRRMVAEGKFGARAHQAPLGGEGGRRGGGRRRTRRPATRLAGARLGAPATEAKGSKRKAPQGAEAPAAGGATKKRATDSAGEKTSRKGEKEASARKNEWRHADGYAQLPVFEPAKPVEVPSRESEKATPDPRKKKEGTDGEKPLADLPVPAWCVEDAIEKRRRASDFDRGGPRPAADTKADDSDGEGSDVSWSALPGTGEPVELVEERKKAKQEAMRAANADILASEAAEAAAAAARAARAAAAEPPPPADAAGGARLRSRRRRRCARDPDRGEWRVPVPSDGVALARRRRDAETLRREMDEAEGSGPRRVVARRETDDAFRVFGVPGYGEALRGVALDVDSRMLTSRSTGSTVLRTTLCSERDARRGGAGFVKTAVSSAKRAAPTIRGSRRPRRARRRSRPRRFRERTRWSRGPRDRRRHGR